MSDSRTAPHTAALALAFDPGQLTSDDGLVWLTHADDRLGVSTMLA